MSPQSKATYISFFVHAILILCALAFGRHAAQAKPPLIMNFSIIQAVPATTPGPPPAAAQAEGVQPDKEAQTPQKEKVPPVERLAKAVKKPALPPPKKTIIPKEPPQVVQKEDPEPQDSAPTVTDSGVTDSAAMSAEATANSGKEAANPSANTGDGGGGLFSSSQLDAPLIVLAQTRPPYPKRARRLNIEGWIKVKFIVDEHGHVNQVTVLDAKPEGIFEQSVLQCVGEWRFKPGTIGGRVVKALVEQTITFKLEG